MGASPSPSGPLPGTPSPWDPIPYRVVSRTVETTDTVTLSLEPLSSGGIGRALPGQFNMVYAPSVGEAAISLSGSGPDASRLLHTVRSAGPITRALTEMRPGKTVGVRGPFGKGWPMAMARGSDVVLVAGGLGLPPLRPVLYEILEHREAYRRVEVIYGARTPRDLVYYDEIQRWRARGDLRFQVTVDAAGMEWYGDVGIVTQRVPDARFEPAKTVAFLCGPEVMMKATARDLVARGVAADRIFVSLERNMKCALAQCGHCQFGPYLLCRDGPVLPYSSVSRFLDVREV